MESSSAEPDTAGCPFPVVPCHSEARGDGFAAARDLAEGDLVLRVAPLAAVPKDAFITSVCASCFQREDQGSSSGGGGGSGAGCSSGLLQLCGSCRAAAFCVRCSGCGWVVEKHAEECHALGALVAMQPATGGGAAAAAADTTTLRLVLSMACFSARARRARRQGRGRGGAAAAAAVAAGAPGELLGEEDVMQDSLEDLEQLMGDPDEDVPEAMQAHFDESCRLLKAVQPAWARTSLEQYHRLATKALLNQHDICLPVVNNPPGPGSEQGAGPDAPAPAPGPGRKRPRSAAAVRPKGGKQAADQALSLCPPLVEAVGEGLFPSVARLNHSCAPNCRLAYDRHGCCVVRVRPGAAVARGEELLAAYVNPAAPREARRRHLFERYGFWCDCTLCAAGG